MTSRLPLVVYTTRQYNAGWRDYERSIDVNGYAKMTTPVKVVQQQDDLDYDYEGSATYTCAVTVTPAMYKELKALHRAMTRSGPYVEQYGRLSFTKWMGNAIGDQFDMGCRCEHDCCGHLFGSGFATPTRRKRTYLVRYTRSRNL